MDIAKAMYLGGKIIYARDKSIDYDSYKDLGLRCYVCGEPVHFRRGEERKPHFAHFAGVDPKQVEVCRLRVASYGTDTENGEYRRIEDKGQRLKIFQSNFIEIIANTIPNFKQLVQVVKESTDSSRIAAVIPNLIRYFVNNSKSLVAQYCQLYQDKLKHITTLQKKISWEAIDFLSIKSSYYLLEQMLWYICSLNKSNQLTFNNRYAEVLLSIIDIVINTPWVEAYRSIFTLQASLVQTRTKEQNQQSSTELKVVESNNKSDVNLESLFGGNLESLFGGNLEPLSGGKLENPLAGLNLHTHLTLSVIVSSVKKDKVVKAEHAFRMRITNHFPSLSVLFELGRPVRKTPKSANKNIKISSYTAFEYEPLMEVAFNIGFKPTITVYRLLSSRAIFVIAGTEGVIDGTYLAALRLAGVTWQAKLVTDKASFNGWSSWNLVALRLLDKIMPAGNESNLGDDLTVKASEYKALSKSDVFKTIQDVYQELTGLGLMVDKFHRVISHGITQYYLAEERNTAALKAASASTSEKAVDDENKEQNQQWPTGLKGGESKLQVEKGGLPVDNSHKAISDPIKQQFTHLNTVNTRELINEVKTIVAWLREHQSRIPWEVMTLGDTLTMMDNMKNPKLQQFSRMMKSKPVIKANLTLQMTKLFYPLRFE